MKKVLALVLAAVMAVGLTACGVNITQMSLPETMEVKVGEMCIRDRYDTPFALYEGRAYI